jgi:hypothetical protein
MEIKLIITRDNDLPLVSCVDLLVGRIRHVHADSDGSCMTQVAYKSKETLVS